LSPVGSPAEPGEAGLRAWVEILLVGGVYFAYSMVRNWFGSAAVEPEVAARNADHIIAVEEAMGLYFEPSLQATFIDMTGFVQFWNLFYSSLHFLVTFGVLIWLYARFPDDFRFWRRAGLVATASAVAGFAAFPLMPPRLLGDCGEYGACRADVLYVDTMVELGGIWSFESSPLASISNQYAAMPSLHIAWALWCALVVAPRVRRTWAKLLAGAYPLLTLFAIVVTANHYWIDGVGGVAIVAFGYGASWLYSLVTNRTPVTAKPERYDSGADDFGTSVDSGVT